MSFSVTLSGTNYQKLSKGLNEGFDRYDYKNKDIAKTESKTTVNNCRYLLESYLVRINRIFF